MKPPWRRFAQPKLGLDTNIRIFFRYLEDFETINRTATSDMGIHFKPPDSRHVVRFRQSL